MTQNLSSTIKTTSVNKHRPTQAPTTFTEDKSLDNAKTNSASAFSQLREQVLLTLNADIDAVLSYANLPEPLHAACHYALTGNGKRVRPLLVASGFQTLTADRLFSDDCRRAMLAVELLHTYSLIHDDLPALDNDDLRRGRATCHKQFDEATALLAGDVLQTLAFEVLNADLPKFQAINEDTSVNLSKIFIPRARRMVAGQMLDINAEKQRVTQPQLEAIHRDKTGALIEAAVLMAAVCGDASDKQMTALENFAQNIGLAFQVQDDILDVTTSTEILGKPAGSDEALNKSTYVTLMGVNDAQAYAQTLFVNAKSALLTEFGTNTSLQILADWIWQRQK